VLFVFLVYKHLIKGFGVSTVWRRTRPSPLPLHPSLVYNFTSNAAWSYYSAEVKEFSRAVGQNGTIQSDQVEKRSNCRLGWRCSLQSEYYTMEFDNGEDVSRRRPSRDSTSEEWFGFATPVVSDEYEFNREDQWIIVARPTMNAAAVRNVPCLRMDCPDSGSEKLRYPAYSIAPFAGIMRTR
jgi:hypothetical protein